LKAVTDELAAATVGIDDRAAAVSVNGDEVVDVTAGLRRVVRVVVRRVVGRTVVRRRTAISVGQLFWQWPHRARLLIRIFFSHRS
jgi:hypothetical protein